MNRNQKRLPLILESQEPISEIVEPDYPISNRTPFLLNIENGN